MSEDEERRISVVLPTPRDLPAFLPYACRQLQAPFILRVSHQTQDEYAAAGGGRTGRSRAALPAASQTPKEGSGSASALEGVGDDDGAARLHADAVHDAQGRLVELALRRARVPCLLLKLVGVCAPHQALLARLTLRACRLDARALHQLVQLLPASRLAELCLDESPLRVGGYHLLLERPSALRRLSLARCSLGDAGAAALAAALAHPLPASRSLRSLSLASNGIGDRGAGALAEALRSNRHLQHLDLADNRVTDAGVAPIFECLAEFPLAFEEARGARRRLIERLRERREVYARVHSELLAAAARGDETSRGGGAPDRRRRTRKTIAVDASGTGISSDPIAAQAETLTEELMGPSEEPFAPELTETRGGVVYGLGNRTLSWLNLAYNALGYASLRGLLRVLVQQGGQQGGRSSRRLTTGGGGGWGGGLVRVVLEGNELPLACSELGSLAARLEDVLDRAARPAGKKPPGSLKSRK